MADIFTSEEVQKLLENKFVVVIGDSGKCNVNAAI